MLTFFKTKAAFRPASTYLEPTMLTYDLRAMQRKKIQKIRDYYGSGWVGPGLTQNFFFFKSSQNSPKPVLIFWSSIGPTMCILSLYTLLKVVGYYDLSVLSMSVMCFQKKFGWGVGEWVG